MMRRSHIERLAAYLLIVVSSGVAVCGWQTLPSQYHLRTSYNNHVNRHHHHAQLSKQMHQMHQPQSYHSRSALQLSLSDHIGDSMILLSDDSSLFDMASYTLISNGVLASGLLSPLVELAYNVSSSDETGTDQSLETLNETSTTAIAEPYKFRLLSDIIKSVTWSARFFLTLRAADTFLGIDSHGLLARDSANVIAATLCTALVLSALKRAYLASIVSSKDSAKLGRVKLIDQLFDLVVGLVAGGFLVDELKVDVSMGIRSVFTAGGVGALFFSLATKEIAEQIVGGLVLKGSDTFIKGDAVRLADGTEGSVERIGLIETDLRSWDNALIRIPNSKLISQKLVNLSRSPKSQLYQILRFHYGDVKKLPATLEDIRQGIADACKPEIVEDGSSPFRVDVFSYNADHIEVRVNVHFRIRADSLKYLDAREKALFAIADAMEKNGVEFAIPSVNYVSSVSENQIQAQPQQHQQL